MPQIGLDPGVPGPGTFVADALAPELFDGTEQTSSTDGSWVEVSRPEVVAVWADTATMGGTGVTVDIEIEAADDASGTNAHVVGKFDTLTEASDDELHTIIVESYKPYMRARSVIAGTSPSSYVTVTVRDKDYHQSSARAI